VERYHIFRKGEIFMQERKFKRKGMYGASAPAYRGNCHE